MCVYFFVFLCVVRESFNVWLLCVCVYFSDVCACVYLCVLLFVYVCFLVYICVFCMCKCVGMLLCYETLIVCMHIWLLEFYFVFMLFCFSVFFCVF